jgi:hypothetical protein
LGVLVHERRCRGSMMGARADGGAKAVPLPLNDGDRVGAVVFAGVTPVPDSASVLGGGG